VDEGKVIGVVRRDCVYREYEDGGFDFLID
jgi:hypothetical protein